MEGTQDTSDDDMSFELTGPSITIPSKRSPKRDLATFLSDETSQPFERSAHPAFNDNNNPQQPAVDHNHLDQASLGNASSWMQWSSDRAAGALQFTCAILQCVYAATAMVAVAVAPAKRQLVSLAQGRSPASPTRRLLWPCRTTSRIFRQIPSASPGQRSTRRVSPPRFRPAASPYQVPGRFPVSPVNYRNDVPASPLGSISGITVDAAILPTATTVDGTADQRPCHDVVMSVENEAVEDEASSNNGNIDYMPDKQIESSSSSNNIHASIQELHNLREIFCRDDEEDRRTSTESMSVTELTSPVPEEPGATFPQSEWPNLVSTTEMKESTQKSSPSSAMAEEADRSIQSVPATLTSALMGSSGFSPIITKEDVEVSMAAKSPMLAHPASLAGSPASPSPASATRTQITRPLKSSIANFGMRKEREPVRTPPRKGWIQKIVSSVKKNRTSPLRESRNGANGRQMKATKSARFSENPVSATKRFVKHETISYPSPISSRDENSILSPASNPNMLQMSPTQQEQDAIIADQLSNFTTETIVFATGADHGSGVGQSSSASHDEPRSHGSESNDNGQTCPTSHTEDETSGLTSTADHNRWESPASSSSDDQASKRSSSTGSVASEQMKTTPKKASDSSPTTPPSKLPEAFADLTVSNRRSSRRTQEKRELSEKRRLEQEAIAAAEKARKDKAEAEERARKQAEEEKERKKNARRMPTEKVIQPLTPAWEQKVTAALAQPLNKEVARSIKGTEISRRDIGFVLPQRGTADDPRGYLNDAIIEAYLLAIVDRYNGIAGHKRGETPKVHAFNNFFYDNLKKHGPDRVKRWASKAKIGGKDLLKADWIFIPICESLHWTLLVVSGTRKTIEYFDSLNCHVGTQIDMVKKWLRSELGSGFKDEEWNVVEDPKFPRRGKGPHQNNGSDCGVFVITTAKMISLGVDPMAVLPTDMVVQRRRLIAELINGGFSGDFEPKIVFE